MSRDEFSRAKRDALARLPDVPILLEFRDYLTRRGVPADRIVFDEADARRRLREAVLLPLTESYERYREMSGETDGNRIWICRGLHYKDTVDTLLHEAMHDSVFILRGTRSGARKGLSEDVEHAVIDRVLPV